MNDEEIRECANEKELTGDSSGCLPGCHDLGVHGDHQVAILDHLLVSLLDLGHHPVGEVIPDQGVGHVDDPLFRELDELSFDGHVIHEVSSITSFGENFITVKSIILRHSQMLNIGGLDVLFLSADEIFKEILKRD